MIPKINLLPWRQTLKMRNHTRFWRCFALVFVASVLLAAAGFWHAWQAKIYQTHINDTINARTQSLQSELIELAHIEKQRSELMEKVQTINELQGGRVQMGRILAHINQALPNGVFIRSVERTGERLVLTGFARSSDGVSQFAKQLDAQAVRDVMVVALTDASDGLKQFNITAVVDVAQFDNPADSQADAQIDGATSSKTDSVNPSDSQTDNPNSSQNLSNQDSAIDTVNLAKPISTTQVSP